MLYECSGRKLLDLTLQSVGQATALREKDRDCWVACKRYLSLRFFRECFEDFWTIDFRFWDERNQSYQVNVSKMWIFDALFVMCSSACVFEFLGKSQVFVSATTRNLSVTFMCQKFWDVTLLQCARTQLTGNILSSDSYRQMRRRMKVSSVSLIIKHAIFKWKHHKFRWWSCTMY